MKIINNLQAMNAARQLNVNTNQAAKSMEKLSSGYRINRAGDDAAGLAITEKMRAQIRGLNQASKNSQEGISLIQTAEAALNETHSVLQRMRELAVQAATGTLQDEDRGQIDKEFQELKAEVDNIAAQTQFNKMTLLDGKYGATVSSDATTITGVVSVEINNATEVGDYTIAYDSEAKTYSVTKGNVTVSGLDFDNGVMNVSEFGITIRTDSNYEAGSLDGEEVSVTGGEELVLQTGANKDEVLAFRIGNMSSSGLGIYSADTLTQTAAQNAITQLEDAIKLVSDERAKLGATQNRLEYKIKNLNSSA